MKLIRSFVFACNGIKHCFVSEVNFRIHVLLAVVAVVFGIVFNIRAGEWVATGFCIAFVLTMEMLNTAIENLCDVVHEDFYPGIKRVKDIAAGAVLISALFSLMTGLYIFIPKIILYFKIL